MKSIFILIFTILSASSFAQQEVKNIKLICSDNPQTINQLVESGKLVFLLNSKSLKDTQRINQLFKDHAIKKMVFLNPEKSKKKYDIISEYGTLVCITKQKINNNLNSNNNN